MTSKLFATLKTRPYLLAAIFMLISTTGFSAMNIGVRMVATELDPTLTVCLRNAITLLMLLPWALRNNAALIRTQRIRGHISRASVGAVGMITWTYCLTLMPLNHATALSFTAPLFAMLFAVAFLGERANRLQWFALFLGFGGTLVILRPSPGSMEWASLLVMFATSTWAVTGILVKSLTRTEPPLRIVFYMNLFMFLWALPLGIYHWQMPDAQAWAILGFIACCSIIMHFSMAKAYSLAPVTRLMPLDFTRLISTALFAWLMFGETSDFLTWVGAAIIIASAMLGSRANRRDAKAALGTVEQSVGP